MTGKELKEHIKHIVNANHWDPFQVLGMHIIDGENKKDSGACLSSGGPGSMGSRHGKKEILSNGKNP